MVKKKKKVKESNNSPGVRESTQLWYLKHLKQLKITFSKSSNNLKILFIIINFTELFYS